MRIFLQNRFTPKILTFNFNDFNRFKRIRCGFQFEKSLTSKNKNKITRKFVASEENLPP